MSGGGSQNVKQESKPFKQQLPFVEDVFGQAAQRYNNLPTDQYGNPTLQFFPGETVAPQGADTLLGQGLARGSTLPISGNNMAATGALRSLLRNPDPANDPTVNAFADAATRPLLDQYANYLNQDDQRAQSQGAFGGSRAALTRGQTTTDAMRNIGEVRAGIYNNAYGQQLNAQQNAINMLGGVNEQLTKPADIFSRVGAQNDDYAQQLINAERERFEFEQAAPDLALNQYANLVNQFSGPTSSTQRVDSSGNAIGNVAGGVLAGVAGRSLFQS